MRFATVATGAVNGYLAARLAAAGREVACLARGAHLEAIRERGLTLETGGGTTVARPAAASDDPAALGPADVVLFAVKAQDLETVAPLCRPLMGPETVVIPFLNGVEASARLEAMLGEGRVLEGLCQISVFVTGPGTIRQTGDFARFRFAERDGTRSERALAIAEAMAVEGIAAGVPEDVTRELWIKFMFLASFAGVTAAARCDAAEIRARPELGALLEDCVGEIGRLARAEGVALTESDQTDALGFIRGLPDAMKASQANDLAAGRPLEVDWLSGAVARLSARHGLSAPAHRTLHAVLSPFRDGRRG